MINSFTICWNGKDRARHIKSEQQRDIFASAKPVILDDLVALTGAAIAPAEAVLDQAREALRRILSDHPGQEVLIVAHKAINRLLLCDLLGLMPRAYRRRLGQQPCALNCVEWRDGEPMVTLLNDVSHTQREDW